MWTEYDTTDCRDCGFTNVQTLLDHRGAQHEQTSEASKDQVDQMRLCDGEVIPRHCDVLMVLVSMCVSVSV
jgi:hypothetical protein